ncbi:MAG TPA: PhzF family phenazine biosynthesis protein [Stellaceae bacterium]|nr:PhzF family phenazine biosynthesis protein [Stellaceae bacterium]
MPETLAIYQVDAFAETLFGGNPAAVVPLEHWLPDETLQKIAAENNLAETAFLVPDGQGWALRWFTPAVEVALCGHATLASGFVIFRFLRPGSRHAAFTTKRAGMLEVSEVEGVLTLDLPSRPPEPVPPPEGLAAALGARPVAVLAAEKLLAVFETEQEVAALAPDFRKVAALPFDGVIATAPGSAGTDFVSRYFAPHAGIDEDPVTGSAHCVLTPYWAARLGRRRLEARQISARGGHLRCEDLGGRVALSGRAQLYMTGQIHVT